jgi:hypothetical protein
MSNLERFQKTYSYRHLIKTHSLEEQGTWQVFGEDRNTELAGQRQIPYLGTYEGSLKDVIDTAVDLPEFWDWGYGGSIKKIEVKPAKRS